MLVDRARVWAALIVFATPLLVSAVIEYRWQGNCRHYLHESFTVFVVFAVILIFSKNPFRSIAACLAYLPVGYIFATEPCTAPRSQGAGGLIYLLSPLFACFVVFWAFVGGYFLRLLFGLEAPQERETDSTETGEAREAAMVHNTHWEPARIFAVASFIATLLAIVWCVFQLARH